MTPEQQRIAIAKACGWKLEPWSHGTRLIRPDGTIANNYYAEHWRLPSYLSDLNAMHDAEKVLFGLLPNAECKYRDALIEVIQHEREGRFIMAIDCVVATSSQRAEAFLRTLNLWTD